MVVHCAHSQLLPHLWPVVERTLSCCPVLLFPPETYFTAWELGKAEERGIRTLGNPPDRLTIPARTYCRKDVRPVMPISELYCSLCQRATSENLQRESVRDTLNQMQKGLSLWRVYRGTVTGLGPHVWGEGKGVAGVLETQGRLEGTSCVSVLLHPRFVQTQAAESWWHSGGALPAAGALSLEWGILVSALRWFIEISTQSLSTIQLFLGKVKAAEPVLVGSYCPIYHFRTENAS